MGCVGTSVPGARWRARWDNVGVMVAHRENMDGQERTAVSAQLLRDIAAYLQNPDAPRGKRYTMAYAQKMLADAWARVRRTNPVLSYEVARAGAIASRYSRGLQRHWQPDQDQRPTLDEFIAALNTCANMMPVSDVTVPHITHELRGGTLVRVPVGVQSPVVDAGGETTPSSDQQLGGSHKVGSDKETGIPKLSPGDAPDYRLLVHRDGGGASESTEVPPIGPVATVESAGVEPEADSLIGRDGPEQILAGGAGVDTLAAATAASDVGSGGAYMAPTETEASADSTPAPDAVPIPAAVRARETEPSSASVESAGSAVLSADAVAGTAGAAETTEDIGALRAKIAETDAAIAALTEERAASEERVRGVFAEAGRRMREKMMPRTHEAGPAHTEPARDAHDAHPAHASGEHAHAAGGHGHDAHGHGEPWHLPRTMGEWGWLGVASAIGAWNVTKWLWKYIVHPTVHAAGYVATGDMKHPWKTFWSNIKKEFAKPFSKKGGGGGHASGGHGHH